MEDKKADNITDSRDSDLADKIHQNSLDQKELILQISKTQGEYPTQLDLNTFGTSFKQLNKISIYVGKNQIFGGKAIKGLFEVLSQIESLTDLKLKIEKGNRICYHNNLYMIEGLNQLKQIKRLNLKLNVISNMKRSQSVSFGKCFEELTQLEDLSITLYRYLGNKNIEDGILNSLKEMKSLEKLTFKIKEGVLYLFDCFNYLNFEGATLPKLKEFSFALKQNTLNRPEKEQVDLFKEKLNIPESLEITQSDEQRLSIYGAFKQLNQLKHLQKVSFQYDNLVPYYMMYHIFTNVLDEDFKHLQMPKWMLNLSYCNKNSNFKTIGIEPFCFKYIQELTLKLQELIRYQTFVDILQSLRKIESLKKLSLMISLGNQSESLVEESQEQLQNVLDNEVIGSSYKFLSQLEEFNLTVNYYYQPTENGKQLLSMIGSLPSLNLLNIHFYNDDVGSIPSDDDEDGNLIEEPNEEVMIVDTTYIMESFDKCINLKDLHLNFTFNNNHQVAEQIHILTKMQDLTLLESLYFKFHPEFKFDIAQSKIFRDTLLTLKNLKQLELINLNFDNSEELYIEIEHLMDGLSGFEILEKLNLEFRSGSLKKESSNTICSQLHRLKVQKFLQLSISPNSEFFSLGCDQFCASLHNFIQLKHIHLHFAEGNVNLEQSKMILQSLTQLKLLEDLKLAFYGISFKKEDMDYIKECLKSFKILEKLNFCAETQSTLYLLNLYKDLPYLYSFIGRNEMVKFIKKGSSRYKFSKVQSNKKIDSNEESEAPQMDNEESKTPQMGNEDTLRIFEKQQKFGINRVKILLQQHSKLNYQDIWNITDLQLPLDIDLRFRYVKQNESQQLLDYLKHFNNHQYIRYVRIKMQQKYNLILKRQNISNIFYRLKYLITFTYE